MTRKLDPKWCKLHAKSWEGERCVWILEAHHGWINYAIGATDESIRCGWTHWQPAKPPRVFMPKSDTKMPKEGKR